MEDSFRVRVDKVFGSLSSSSTSSSSSLASLWSLTDEEIEKKEWSRDLNRPKDDDIPPGRCFSSKPQPPRGGGGGGASSSLNFGKELESDLQNLNDDDADDEGDADADEMDIRSSIGLDSTLDYEEEEDEYDKVAVGMENVGDRLYMRDVTDYDGVDVINTYRELPYSFSSPARRDPRANHLAAKLRLKEDSEAAGDFRSPSGHSETTTSTNKPVPTDVDDASVPKPILKKRLSDGNSKSLKRVRFDPQFDNASDITHQIESVDLAPASPPPDDDARPGLPDYLRNPSKYTCYTMDSVSEMDDECNRRAYLDCFNLIKKQTTADDADTVDSSKPPVFTSRKPPTPTESRGHEIKQNNRDGVQNKAPHISIAAGEAENTEICSMEEDEQETAVNNNGRKSGRQYRTRTGHYSNHSVGME